MATSSDVSNQPIEIDPNFFLPPSIVDARYADTTTRKPSDSTGGTPGGVGQVDTVVQTPDTPEVSPIPTQTGPVAIPSDITIVSQTVRMSDDGSWVVDVVLDVQPDDGATVNYEARVMLA